MKKRCLVIGTGLSYSEGVTHYETDDHKTAEDLYAAVLKFLKLFPEFAANKFFVAGTTPSHSFFLTRFDTAGESYAGVYVPMLVDEIVKGNEARPTPNIRLVVRSYSFFAFPAVTLEIRGI